MSITIRAHYDGKVIVPDEPLDLPVDQPLEVVLEPVVEAGSESSSQQTIKERLERLRQATGIISGPSIPLEALRRENLYEERT
jgi:hypothetical protein